MPLPARVGALIQQLGSEDFEKRQAADATLGAIGESALPALRTARRSADAEIRRRAVDLEERIRVQLHRVAAEAIRRLQGRVDPDSQWILGRGLRVDLGETRVTNSDLRQIRWYRGMHFLSLQGTLVTDTGMRYLDGLETLDALWLCETAVTNKGLVHLKGCPDLRSLGVSGRGITDRGLRMLAGCRRLQFLFLSNTKTTRKGQQWLKRALPDLDITVTK